MKRLTGLLLVLFLLTGCTENDGLDRALEARSRLQNSACRFRATVSADYEEMIHTFVLDCEADNRGNVDFTVTAPDTISGITGRLTGESGFLTFDGELLAFSMLADGQLSPVSAPWIFLHALRGGWLRSAGVSGEALVLTVDDTYAGEPLQADIRLNPSGVPTGAEILWQGRRILTLVVESFELV